MKILIAVEAADEAHETALVAKKLFPEADHLIISAAVPASYMVTDPIGGGVFSPTLSAESLDFADRRADEAVNAAQDVLGANSETQVDHGPAGQIICDEAAEHGVDVIVIGRRTKGWLSRLFDPSISDYVVRHAPCPVLVVRETGPAPERAWVTDSLGSTKPSPSAPSPST